MIVRPVHLAWLVLAGCAASPPQAQSTTENNNDLVCQRVYPTGSNIPVTRCTTFSQREQEKRNADALMDSVRRPGNVSGASTQ